MKTLSIAGRLGKDAELRHTTGGDSVLGFTVAVDDGYGDKKSTLWFDCSVWGKRAGALEPHLKKGQQIAASGDFGTRVHEGKTYLTLRVGDLTMQGGKSEARPEPKQAGFGSGGRPGRELDDEIPFAPEFR